MTHEEAVPLVSDWARGGLDADRSRSIEAHVRICAECRAAAEAATDLHTEAARLLRTPSAHPSAEVLAHYVSDSEAQSIATLARIGAHVRGCDPCREDVALMREADRPAWWRANRASWDAPGAGTRWLQPALALCALLLAFPAWRGLVELPRERAASEQRIRAADDARARAEGSAREPALPPRPSMAGGGVAALVLQGTLRDAGALPSLRSRPSQPLQPVLLDVTPPAGVLHVVLVRADGAVVWSAVGPREEFWDETNRLMGLLVPSAVLAAGEYRIEVRRGADRAPFFVSRFRVASPNG